MGGIAYGACFGSMVEVGFMNFSVRRERAFEQPEHTVWWKERDMGLESGALSLWALGFLGLV